METLGPLARWLFDRRRFSGHPFVLVWRGAVCLALFAGCHSTEPANTSENPALVSVVIRNNTPGQIEAAANAVFEDKGYIAGEGKRGVLVYEKKGSKMNNFAYGSWMGDEPVWVRVKLMIVPVGEGAYRVDCNPVLVQDRGRAAEEEIRINRMHRGKYQDLLNEVAARLGQKVPK